MIKIRTISTHWGRVTHICVNDLTSIGSDNGLSPGRRQAIIRTNAGILLIRPLGTHFSEFLSRNSNIFIQENAFESVVCEKADILSRPQWVNFVIMKISIKKSLVSKSGLFITRTTFFQSVLVNTCLSNFNFVNFSILFILISPRGPIYA